ncbi:MAG: AAA family ATPase [Gammaproteobacteria bacterium]|nr:AAA family ATPase [Gammaproteobacteria bacterium]MBQ0840444.1 AAA family ATPase [Gammaproteobacteria bacterium]
MASNFFFLMQVRPHLAKLGSQAELYAYSDPQSAVVKLRCFAEIFVGIIYQELSLSTDGLSSFYEKLENPNFIDAVEDCVVKKLHALRMKGNKAAHLGGVSVGDALWLIKESYFIGAWLHVAKDGGAVDALPTYRDPQAVTEQQQAIMQDKERLEQALALQTTDLEAARQELLQAETQQLQAQATIDQLNQAVDKVGLEALKATGQQAVRSFDFKPEETARRMSINDAFAEYQLTAGQQELVACLDGFLTSDRDKVFLLKGYAGTGKTFITKGLTEFFRAIGRNYVLAAPTGKASKVIAKKTRSPAYTLHKTIYSFKDIKEYTVDGLNGSATYKFYADLAVNGLSADTVYIVDESSMISDIYNESEFFRCGSGHLLRDFLKFVNLDHNDHRKKVIFIGDDAQLPPVGMKESPALNSDYLQREYGLGTSGYELTEVVRQKADSGVMHNAVTMRKALREGVFNQLDFDLSHPDLEHVDHQDLIARYLLSCNGKINSESIVLAHSNADVALYNRCIRDEFFPGQPEICKSDKVMAVTNSDAHGFFISNGDFGQVRQVYGDTEHRSATLKRKSEETGEVEHIVVPLQFRDVRVGFRDLEGDSRFFDAKIIENLLYSDTPSLSSDENKALYLDFCIRNKQLKPGTQEFKNTLLCDPYFNALRLKFGYAITCHKAQGSEWNHVFVKCKTGQTQLCSEYFRWLYTAITRTSSRLYLLEEPHIKLGSGIKTVTNPGWVEPVAVSSHKTEPQLATAGSTAVTVPYGNLATVNSDEMFGITPENTFLFTLLAEVRSLLVTSGIEISEIHHQQYQEAYFFTRGAESERINFSYKSNQKISSVLMLNQSALGEELLGLLSPLKGRLISNELAAPCDAEFEFSEPFLHEFHLRLLAAAKGKGMAIGNVEEQQYSLRYYFQKREDRAVVDIYYNKKERFTHSDPKRSLSTSNELVQEALSLVSEDLA